MNAIPITHIGALIVGAIASYTDIRTGKIYNKLTFPAMLVGMLVRAVEFAWQNPETWLSSGIAGAINGFLGCLLGIGIMSLTKAFLRQMGHADSKLMGAIGAFEGPAMIVVIWFWYCMSYGLYFLPLLYSFPWGKLPAAISFRNPALVFGDEKFQQSRKKVHPVAPLITLGLVLAIVLQNQTMVFFGFSK